MYDLCIVGAGMVGSAAARHATRTSGYTVCLIGPSEPKTMCAETESDIYASYYDEGRIVRCTDTDVVWTKLAQDSIKRFRDLEHHSGIGFYTNGGNLVIGEECSDVLKKIDHVATQAGITVEKMDNKCLRERYSYLKLNEDTYGLIECGIAGYINPRNMVQAQKKMAAKQGCTVIDDVVCHVCRTIQSDGTYVMRVETEGGRVIESKAVLLATGAFTALRDLLPGIKHDHLISPLSVSFLEVDDSSMHTLREMPCVIYYGRPNENWQMPPTHKNKDHLSFYMLPPIKYPDGRYYIKLGLRGAVPEPLTSSAAVKQWFDRGDSHVGENVAKLMESLFQDVKFKSWKSGSCVITETPTVRPYIDMVHSQLGVAIGGNGYAAKSSDEIGRLAISMMHGFWDTTISHDAFRLRLLSSNSSRASFSSFDAKL